MLVRLLSPPVERSTAREDGVGVMLDRLLLCSGRVSKGYSSLPSLGWGAPSESSGWARGTLGSWMVLGEELTGFQSRDAGVRGAGCSRKEKWKMRWVRDQRAGGGSERGANADDGEVGNGGRAVDAVVAACLGLEAGEDGRREGEMMVEAALAMAMAKAVMELLVLLGTSDGEGARGKLEFRRATRDRDT